MEHIYPVQTDKAYTCRTLRLIARAIEEDRIDSGFLNIEISRAGQESETSTTICASVEYRSGGMFERGEWKHENAT